MNQSFKIIKNSSPEINLASILFQFETKKTAQ